MKIDIITSTANDLKTKIFKAAKDNTLRTWEVVKGESGTEYLTPKTDQYNNIVMLKFVIDDITKNLIVSTMSWKSGTQATHQQKAIVIGQFTGALLEHFNSDYKKLEIK